MLKRFGILFLATLVSACGGSDASFDNGGARLLTAIEVSPSEASVPAGLQQSYTATGVYSDGSREDLSASAIWASAEPTIASVDNSGVATGITPGTTRISASVDGVSGDAELTVTDAVAQVLQILPPAATIPINTTQDYRAYAVYSDGRVENVTFSAEWVLENDSGILAAYEPGAAPVAREIDDFGTAIGVAVGEDELVASFEGLSSSSSITVTEPTLESISVTPQDETTPQGTLVAYTATGNYSDGSTANLTKVVTWSSSESAVATISNTDPTRGIASALAAGATEIVASFEGLSDQTSLTVLDDNIVRIDVLPPRAVIDVGQSLQYQAIAVTESGRSLDVTSGAEWVSQQESVASIEEGGSATGRAPGNTTISASYDTVTGSAQLEVRGAEINLVAISVEPVNAALYSFTTLQYTAIAIYSDGSNADVTELVTWGSADSNILVLSNDDDFGRGLAFGLQPGETLVTAALNGVEDSTPVTVVQTQAEIELVVRPPLIELPEGGSTRYGADLVINGERAIEVSDFVAWSSSDTTVATIDATGLARALAEGSTEIIARLTVGDISLEGSGRMDVRPAAPGIVELAVTPATASVIEGGQQQYQARVIYSDGTTQDVTDSVAWSSGDAAIATVDLSGLATGVNAGSARINALLPLDSGDLQGSANIRVLAPQVTGLTVTPPSATTLPAGEVQFTATAEFENGTTEDVSDSVSWLSSNETVAQVDSRGLATGLNPGASDIQAILATPEGSFSDSGRLRVNPPEVVIEELVVDPASAEVLVGGKQQFTARVLLSDGSSQDVTTRVSWGSDDNAIAQVNAQGRATGVSEGSTGINAILDYEGTRYTDSAALTVTAAAVTIEELIVDPPSATVLINGTQAFTARVLLSDGSSQDVSADVSWSSSDSSVAQVDALGLATGLAEGRAAIIATLLYEGMTYSDDGRLTVEAPPVTIEEVRVQPPRATVIVEGTQQFTAEAVLSDGRVVDVSRDASWQAVDSAIATVNGAGLATGVAEGVTGIVATIEYEGDTFSGSGELTVTPPAVVVQDLVVSPVRATVLVNGTQAFTARALLSDGSEQDVTDEVTWTSSDSQVASVDAAGVAVGRSAGASDVVARLNVDGTLFEDSGRLRVEDPEPSVTALRVEPASSEILVESREQFLAFAELSDGRDIDVTRSVSWNSSDETVAHVNAAGRATGLAAGQADISATLALEGESFSDSGRLTVIAQAITIEELLVEPASAEVLVGGKQAYSARVVLSDGSQVDVTRDVSWISSDSSIASVNSQGRATGLSAGTADITANLLYEGVTYTDSGELTVTPAAITIEELVVDPATATVLVDGSAQFEARVLLSDGSSQDVSDDVSWSVGNAAVAHVDDSGLATGLSEGRSEITASLLFEGETFSDSGRLTVEPPVVTIDEIRVQPPTAEVFIDGRQQYTAEAVLSDGSTVDVTRDASWRTGATAIASVSNSGLATGVAEGTTSVTATVVYQGDTFTGAASITVNPPAVTVEALLVEPALATVLVSSSQQYEARLVFTDGSQQDVSDEVTWTSSDTQVASVDSSGLAVGQAPGASDIGASLNVDGTLYSDSGRLRVEAPATVVTGLRVEPASAEILVDTSQQFRAIAELSDGSEIDVSRDVSWDSADEAVAHIDGRGRATGISEGNSSITATLVSDTDSFSDSALLTVLPLPVVVEELIVTPESAEILIQGTQQYTAVARLSDGSERDVTSDVAWSSSNSSTAQVDSSGLATGLAEGVTSIRALLSYGDGQTARDSVSLTVKAPEVVIESLEVAPPSATVVVEEQQRYTATATLSDGSTQDVSRDVTWTSSDTSIAAVNKSGLATGIAEGNALILASIPTDGGTVSDSADILVEAPPPELTSLEIFPALASIPLGTTQDYRAIAFFDDGSSDNVTFDGTWSLDTTPPILERYEPDNNLALGALDDFGTALAIRVGEDTLRFAYEGLSAASAVQVTEPVLQAITVSPRNENIAVATTLDFTATGVYSDGTSRDITRTAQWSSSVESVASISNTPPNRGRATALSIGITQITASQDGVSDSTGLEVDSDPVIRVDVVPATATINVDATQQFTAFAVRASGETDDVTTDAQWQSSDTEIASIDLVGLATGVAAGSVDIAATFSEQTGSAVLTVVQPVTLKTITIEPAFNVLFPLQTVQLKAIATYTDNTTRDVTNEVTWSSDSGQTVQVSNSDFFGRGLALALLPGDTDVRASLAGEPESTRGSSAFTVLPVGSIVDKLEVSPPLATIVTNSVQQYEATLVLNNGIKIPVSSYVSWRSSDTAIATIDGRGLAHGEAEGQVTIIATLRGAADITGTAILNVEDPITITSVVVSPPSASVIVGDSTQYTADAVLSNGNTLDVTDEVDWTTGDNSIARIKPGGEATGVSSGSTSILATLDTGNELVQGDATITVAPAVTVIEVVVSPPLASILEGGTQQFRADVRLSDGTDVDVTDSAAWQSSDTSVAQVAPGGLATGKLAGQVTITATVSHDGLDFSDTAELTVNAISVDNIQISPKRGEVLEEESLQFTATAVLTDGSTEDITAEATWFVLDTDTATIESGSNPGLATGLAAGVTTVYVEYSEDGMPVPCLGVPSCEATLEVYAPTVQELQVTPARAEITVADQQAYVATAVFDNGDRVDVSEQVSWQSSDTAIASIDQTGTAEGVAPGQVGITATYLAGDSSLQDSASLTVVAPPVSIVDIKVTPENRTILVGDELQYAATALLSDDSTQDVSDIASWNTDDETIAEIDGDGLATGLTAGIVTVAADVNIDGTVYSGATRLTVEEPLLVESVEVTPKDRSILVDGEQQYQAVAVFSDGSSLDVTEESTWFTSDATIAAIGQGSDAGLATGKAEGVVTVWASYSFDGMAFPCEEVPSCRADLTVESPVVVESYEVLPDTQTVVIDTTAQYEARIVLSDGTVIPLTEESAWQSSDDDVATPQNPDGLFIGVAEGTVVITASADYDGNSYSADAELVVEPPAVTVLSIEVEPDPVQKYVGSTQTFTALAILSNGEQVEISDESTWTSDDESVAVVDINTGEAQALAVGTANISANWAYEGQGFEDSAAMEVLALAVTGIEVIPHEIAARPSEQLRLFKDAGKDPGSEPPGHQYTAIATYPDGSLEDITQDADWRSTNTQFANVTSTGYVTGTGEENDQEGPDFQIQASADGRTDGSLLQMDGDCKPFEDKDFVLQDMEIQPRFNAIIIRPSQSLRLQAVGFYRKDSAIFCASPVSSDSLDDQPNKNRLKWSVESGGEFVEVDTATGVITARNRCGQAVVRATKERLIDSDQTEIYTAEATVFVCVP